MLMVLKVRQTERSTVLHSPTRVHILSTVVVLLGQGRVWVVPAGVSGQKRNPVCSESQTTAGASVRTEKDIHRPAHKLGCLPMFSTKFYHALHWILELIELYLHPLLSPLPRSVREV